MSKTGIIFRRDTKAKLLMDPPALGELVFATDTGEHGWLSATRNVLWRKLSVDNAISGDLTTKCYNTEHINTESTQNPDGIYAELLTLDYSSTNNYTVSYHINIIVTIVIPDQLATATSPFIPSYTEYEHIDCSGKFQIPSDILQTDGIVDTFISLKGYSNMNKNDTAPIYLDKYKDKKLSFRKNIDGTLTVLLKTDRGDGLDKTFNYISDFVVSDNSIGISINKILQVKI